jgi:benzoate/toluate 1,2-dioxygenase beta subunit
MDRYAELADLVASVPLLPDSDPALVATSSVVLAREARLLDTHQFERWADWFTPDAVVWFPLPGSTEPMHPAHDQSLFLDDVRRIHERVAWRSDPSAWGQQPPSQCVRTVGLVEAWGTTERTITRSTFTIAEYRHGTSQLVAGYAIHELVGPDHRCRSRIVVLPQLADGIRNPSFLL